MKMVVIGLRAFLYLVAALLFFGWVALSIRRFDRNLGVLPAWSQVPGIMFVAAGGILLVLCFAIFAVKGQGTPVPIDPPRKLVALGPYKYVRNPIHMAWVMLFLGWGLCLRSPSVLIFAFAFLVICYAYARGIEEPGLRNRFGASYEEYCKVVPRYIPKLNFLKRHG